eukprot:TRINITY_DN8580_c0_g1_i3.p1 TRINITY_DN8580_c0_g1~~TRINITY_DN8580_c0_g1_i3.p1  ORF type:complete len:263 (-),score=39.54 TRINITY_DN8580_c0_g1_i3:280-1068(-)
MVLAQLVYRMSNQASAPYRRLQQLQSHLQSNMQTTVASAIRSLHSSASTIAQSDADIPIGGLDTKEWRRFPLIEKRAVNHNTNLYRFALPNSTDRLNLPIGQHVSLRAWKDDKPAMRSYTPVSTSDVHGYFDLIIKIYPQGVMSQHVERLRIGDCIVARGPKGAFKYQPNMKRRIGMIAGGSGITPMLQVSRAVLSDKADNTQLSLIFANIAERDILLREELDSMAAASKSKFNVYYVLEKPAEGWPFGTGFVSPDHIKAQV